MRETQEVGGQVALVTGGGRGLGRAYAQALAQAGMAVAVTARTEPELQETVQQIEQSGGRALAIPADVTDANAVAQLVATVERQLGPVDLLVNNAGRAIRGLDFVPGVRQSRCAFRTVYQCG
jgi:NAD(P)-dependent dehydrogenase (short-subunit alcohol dehydrogenase family)